MKILERFLAFLLIHLVYITKQDDTISFEQMLNDVDIKMKAKEDIVKNRSPEEDKQIKDFKNEIMNEIIRRADPSSNSNPTDHITNKNFASLLSIDRAF